MLELFTDQQERCLWKLQLIVAAQYIVNVIQEPRRVEKQIVIYIIA